MYLEAELKPFRALRNPELVDHFEKPFLGLRNRFFREM